METIRMTGTPLQDEKTFAQLEWLVTNGIGGFAGSSLVGANTRGYHGLLIASLCPPLERMLLVSKLDEAVVNGETELALSTNIYADDVQPKGYQYLNSFIYSFHPTFVYSLPGGQVLEKKIYMIYGENTTVVEYAYVDGSEPLTLKLTPYLNYRDYHGNTQASGWPWELQVDEQCYGFTAYPGAHPVYLTLTMPGQWMEERSWKQGLYYPIEASRGLKDLEDHYIPGSWMVTLEPGAKLGVILSTEDTYNGTVNLFNLYQKQVQRIEDLLELARAKDPMTQRLVMAADQFIVHRDSTGTATVIAGYPWFTDWGRDSMIALPGLAMATRRWEEGKEILETFARYVRHGLIPNRFPDIGEEPEYNTVDASLWFFVAFYHYHEHTLDEEFIRANLPLLKEMIRCHQQGTLWGIRMEEDHLLTQGQEGVQLTWMDAKVGDWVVTPRQGKAVEINALWYNAVKITAYFLRHIEHSEHWVEYEEMAQQILRSFQREFWNEAEGYLYDRIDELGIKDPTIRPNQVFALSLPFPLLDRAEGKRMMEVMRKHLATPFGLRSLSTADEAYHGFFGGDQLHRDAAYHQGTVWGWLMGPYLEALLYVEEDTLEAKERIMRLMEPLLAHMVSNGAIGQISEIFMGDHPFTPCGCYAQAWSVGELLRIRELIHQP